jgi:hypothetical protein
MHKILIVTQRLSPIPGVGKNRIENIINQLSTSNHIDILILKSSFEPFIIKNYFKNIRNIYRFPYPEIYYNLDDGVRSKTDLVKLLRLVYNKTLRWKFLYIFEFFFKRFIKETFNNKNYSLIISTSPHPIVNIYAEILSDILKIKWIADVRDPYDRYHLKEAGYRAMKSADLITATTKTLADIIEEQTCRKKIAVLSNGHNLKKDSIKKLQNINLLHDNINIFYGGSTQSLHRIRILKKLINSLSLDDRVKLYIATTTPLYKSEAPKNIIQLGYLKKDNYLSYIAKCDYSINITEPDDKYAIPYKIYEILGLNKRIISVSSPNAEVYKILVLNKNEHILLESTFDKFDHTALQKNTHYEIINEYSFEMLNLKEYIK